MSSLMTREHVNSYANLASLICVGDWRCGQHRDYSEVCDKPAIQTVQAWRDSGKSIHEYLNKIKAQVHICISSSASVFLHNLPQMMNIYHTNSISFYFFHTNWRLLNCPFICNAKVKKCVKCHLQPSSFSPLFTLHTLKRPDCCSDMHGTKLSHPM